MRARNTGVEEKILAFVNAYRENKDCIFNGAIVSIHGNAKIDVDPNDEQNTKIEFICRQLRLLIEKKGVTFECTENPGCGYPAPFVPNLRRNDHD